MLNKIKKIISKKNKSKIICLTAYSKNFAEEIDKYTDIVLVGDSLGSVLYNYNSTRKVNLENMIKHSKSVRMGVKKSLIRESLRTLNFYFKEILFLILSMQNHICI